MTQVNENRSGSVKTQQRILINTLVTAYNCHRTAAGFPQQFFYACTLLFQLNTRLPLYQYSFLYFAATGIILPAVSISCRYFIP
jgi:hypothetical protein